MGRSFVERMTGVPAVETGILEEAQKTFNLKYSKPAANMAKKVSSVLPNAVGGRALRQYSNNVGTNRSQLAKSIRSSRARGGIGRVNAQVKSSQSNPNATFMDTKEAKSYAKGGFINGPKTQAQIKNIAMGNPENFGSSRPSFMERMSNKVGRGGTELQRAASSSINNTVIPGVSLLKDTGAAMADSAAQRAQDIINAPLQAQFNQGTKPGSAARPI